MEKQQGRKFVPGSMPSGSILLEVQQHLPFVCVTDSVEACGSVECNACLTSADAYVQLVYKHLEEQAAANDTNEPDLAAEEEALLHGGNEDYPQQLTHAVESLHESSVISICCWPGDNCRVVTGSGKLLHTPAD